MPDTLVLYAGGFLTFTWGVSHLIPTRSVVSGFGDISRDNTWIITMEWITEGVCLIFIGLLVAMVTWIDRGATVSRWVYGIAFADLNVLSIVSLFTGFKVNFLPFKLCPVIFTGSSLLILAGGLL